MEIFGNQTAVFDTNIDPLYLEPICRHELDKFLKQIEREKVVCTTI